MVLVKELPLAFNTAVATGKEFEGEYDFKRPLKKEKDRKKTIVLAADSINKYYDKDKENQTDYVHSEDEVNFKGVHFEPFFQKTLKLYLQILKTFASHLSFTFSFISCLAPRTMMKNSMKVPRHF